MFISYMIKEDQAKCIRKALKESFPKVKFLLRASISIYRVHTSIRITWTDGPKEKWVRSVIRQFEGTKDNIQYEADSVFLDREYSEKQEITNDRSTSDKS